MVNLKEVFNLLATGEFAHIGLHKDSLGTIKESEYPKVVNQLNLGMLEIYKRFQFLENELYLHIYPDVERYYLQEDRMADSYNISEKTYLEYPDDSNGCLNFIEIKGIFDSEGNELFLNNRFKTPAISQLSHDVIKITGHTVVERYTVVYQAYPDKIVIDDDFDPADIYLNIPDSIIEPLLNFVAWKVYKPMGANTTSENDGSQSYQAQYELACQKIELFGLDTQNDDKEEKFHEEGWA